MHAEKQLPLAACAKTFSGAESLLRAAQWRVQRDAVMQVIKELSFATPDNRKKAFPATEEAMKVQRSTLILRMWRSQGRFVSLSHCHRHKCVVATLLVSADSNEIGENTEEMDEVFPSEAQNDSSLES